MRTPLLILGAGAFAEDVYDIACDTGRFDVVGFACTAGRDTMPASLCGLPVHWLEDVLPTLPDTVRVASGFGSPARRVALERCGEFGLLAATVVHPTARVSTRAELEDGVLVGPLSAVSTGCRLGRGCIVNRGVTVGHHTVVGRYATLAPGVNLAGHVTLMEGATVGMGANVLENRLIGAASTIGAGAVVTRDVEAETTVVGIPAKPLGQRAA